MRIVEPAYVPDPGMDTDAMQDEQRALVEDAIFTDEFAFDISSLSITDPLSLDDPGDLDPDAPVVAGIDQAFLDEEAVSAVVAVQDGRVVETVCARTPLEIPYIPGLLAYREGGPIIAALEQLSVDPHLLVFDGSGRIHFRQAGIATHIGVIFDTPAIGVAKRLLCGTPAMPLEDPLESGTRVPIEADEDVEAESGTLIGYAYQSRQFPNPERRHVNPLYVSPGHRIGADSAVDAVAACGAGYKLPEPTRLADRLAGECKD